MKRKVDIIYDILNDTTGEYVSYSKTTTYYDGTSMTDAKVDGVVYVKSGSEYFKSTAGDYPRASQYGIIGDGVDKTALINSVLARPHVKGLIFDAHDKGDITISGTVQANGKRIIVSNGNTFIGPGTINNFYLQADRDARVFQGGVFNVTNLLNRKVYATWLGFVEDRTTAKTDNLPMWNKFKACAPSPTLVFPQTQSDYSTNVGYYFSNTIVNDKNLKVIGGNIRGGYPTTRFWFHGSVTMATFVWPSPTESNVVEWENIMLSHEDYTPTLDIYPNARGMVIRTRVNLNNIRVYGCNGACWDIYGDVTGSNSNLSNINNCDGDAGLYGWYINGPNSNLIRFNNCSAVANKRWGVYSTSFLGSDFTIHVDNNGLHKSVMVTHLNKTYQAINKVGVVNQGNIPATSPEFWHEMVSGEDGEIYNTNAAEPWDNTKEYFSGGGIACVSETGYDFIKAIYSEPWQPKNMLGPRSIAIGGMKGNGFLGGVQIDAEIGQLWVKSGGFRFLTRNMYGQEDLTSFQNQIRGRVAIYSAFHPLALDSSNNGTQLLMRFQGVDMAALGSHTTGFYISDAASQTLLHIDLATGAITNKGLIGTGTEMVVANSNGTLSRMAIPSGGGTQTLTASQIAYGSGANAMTSNANFTYDPVFGQVQAGYFTANGPGVNGFLIGTNSFNNHATYGGSLYCSRVGTSTYVFSLFAAGTMLLANAHGETDLIFPQLTGSSDHIPYLDTVGRFKRSTVSLSSLTNHWTKTGNDVANNNSGTVTVAGNENGRVQVVADSTTATTIYTWNVATNEVGFIEYEVTAQQGGNCFFTKKLLRYKKVSGTLTIFSDALNTPVADTNESTIVASLATANGSDNINLNLALTIADTTQVTVNFQRKRLA